MKLEIIKELCAEYDELLAKDGVVIKHRERFSERYDMNHIRWMINEIPSMLNIPCKMEKVNRWLGFIQGVLWLRGYYTIEEMKGHNRSGDECKEDVLPKPDDQYYWYEGGVVPLHEKE